MPAGAIKRSWTAFAVLLKVNCKSSYRSIRGQCEVRYEELPRVRVTASSISAYINARPGWPTKRSPLGTYVLPPDELYRFRRAEIQIPPLAVVGRIEGHVHRGRTVTDGERSIGRCECLLQPTSDVVAGLAIEIEISLRRRRKESAGDCA